uniref:Rieske domain-containing protein n=1 Tax=Pseudo-nitzschia australis TaxID=44445 RepID=A0A7S4A9I6_9STRA|mmetsp:Transcript_26853/g.58924  ORF Transcript_26853/g.58924 Transcript_26853/m.58924 type:complete len:532 (+) Transcript_26853:543-2138(+)
MNPVTDLVSSTKRRWRQRQCQQRSRSPNSCEKTKRRNNNKCQSFASRSLTDRLYLTTTLSILVFFLVACSTTLKHTHTSPMLLVVTAFVQNGGGGFPHNNYGGVMPKHKRPTTTTTITTNPILLPLCAKQKSQEEDSTKKDSSSDKDGDDKESMFGSLFKSKDNKVDGATEEESKSVPIIGRFFKTDEEKAEKERLKRLKKVEKEQMKVKQREMRGAEGNKKRNKVIPAVKNYFEERQIRKDGEELRLQVQERQRQAENEAEELRQAVKMREEERKRQREGNQKKPSPDVLVSEESDTERKIATQKELDTKRREREERKMAEETARKNNVGSSGTSKSERFSNAVSAAQKFVSGVLFETDSKKNEEWIVVAPKTRISPGEIVPVTAGGIDLLLVASKDGSAVHCVANSCPHLGTPLEVGTLDRLPIETSFAGDSTDVKPVKQESSLFKENDISRMLKQDGCEDCIVCPLHKTAFALESGEVRGEWCPYPPVIGKLTGTIKQKSNLPVFDVRTKGKNIEVRLNTPVEIGDNS